MEFSFSFSGSHSGLYSVDTKGFSQGLKQRVHELEHPPPSSTELKNTRIYSLHSTSYTDGKVLNYLSTKISSAVTFICWEQFQQFWTLCSHHLDKAERGSGLICRSCGGSKGGLCVEWVLSDEKWPCKYCHARPPHLCSHRDISLFTSSTSCSP
jgi:hypothetical protein